MNGLTEDGERKLAKLRHEWDAFYSVWWQDDVFCAMRKDNGALCRREDADELAREIQADYDALPVLP